MNFDDEVAKQARVTQASQHELLKEVRRHYELWYAYIEEVFAADVEDEFRDAIPVARMLSRANREYIRQVIEQRKAQLGYPATEEGTHQLHLRIRNELNAQDESGIPFPDGKGRVWYNGQCAPIHHEGILEELVRTAPTQTRTGRRLAIGGTIGVVALLVLVCVGRSLWSLAATTPTTEPMTYMSRTPIPLPAVVSTTYAESAVADRRYPFTICVDEEAELIPGTTISITSTHQVAHYTVTRGLPYDVRLLDCTRMSVRGMARYTDHTTISYADDTLLERITVQDATYDPSIALNQLAIDLTLTDQRWREAVLIADDGTRWNGSHQSAHTVRYVVPRTNGGFLAALEHTDDSGTTQLLPLMVPLLTNRQTFLSELLTIELVEATRVNSHALTLAVTARGERPVEVHADDLTVTVDDVLIPIRGDVCAVTTELTVCSFTMDFPVGQSAVLSLAGMQYTILSS
ncbi:MAG: hypothetical protein AAGF95_30995 [Chloroflexota bacterium]